MLEGRAEVASQAQAEQFRRDEAAKRQEFKKIQAAGKVQFQLVPGESNKPAPETTEN
jgi:hypothetical protein